MRTATPRAAAVAVRAIDPDVLVQLRVRDDAGREPRSVIDAGGGSPLRCCLRLAEPGEQLALVSYAPLRRWAAQAGADPGAYDEVGPVFIHPAPCAGPSGSGYPEALTGSRRVFRGYAADGRIRCGRLAGPEETATAAAAEALLAEILADPGVVLVHARAVEFGCFTFEVRRVS